MKILVFADSHGRSLGMYDAIEREAPDAVIHLGDYAEDARKLKRSYPGLTVWFVRGNNDFEPDTAFNAVIAPGGVPMYLTHGHKERVGRSSLGILSQRAGDAGCKVALYGHTHRLLDTEADGIHILNPGSISLPRGGPASYLRLIADKGRLLETAALDETGQPYRANERTTGWI